jgi:hypothetical protein
MSDANDYPTTGRHVVGVFRSVDGFKQAAQALRAEGFERAAVSVLAGHDAVADHFGGEIPAAEDLADRLDTPREDLDTEGAIDAVIDFVARGLSTIGGIVVAGAAFAVGGPVGIATTTGMATEATVEEALSDRVHADYTERYEQSVRDGGLVCWVHVYDAAREKAALAALRANGGDHVHVVDLG